MSNGETGNGGGGGTTVVIMVGWFSKTQLMCRKKQEGKEQKQAMLTIMCDRL